MIFGIKRHSIMAHQLVLITGGCRSGKSRHALELGASYSGRKVFVATAEAKDSEMEERIRRHQKERGDEWETVECPVDLQNALKKEGGRSDVLVVDCLTLWISNLLLEGVTAKCIHERVAGLLRVCAEISSTVIVITNEVGAGIVPESRLGREFRDIAGMANQQIAKGFEKVIHMISGIPQVIKADKGEPPIVKSSEEERGEFSPESKKGLYEAIYKRRDIRHFSSQPVSPGVLGKVLHAAHHAGSVGYMQPWNFIVIDDPEMKGRIARNFETANAEAGKRFSGDRKQLYDTLKLEGIQEAPVNICVTCDRSRSGPHVLGRDSMPDTDIYSTCCAIQNLWLAARAEGLGVGWVSILCPDQLKEDLALPDSVVPVAYLCVGYTDAFTEKPLLEIKGWDSRISLENLIFYNGWENSFSNKKIELPKE